MADRDIVNTEHAVEMFGTILARSCGVVPTRRGNTNLRANEAAFGWASVLSYELDLERRQYLV